MTVERIEHIMQFFDDALLVAPAPPDGTKADPKLDAICALRNAYSALARQIMLMPQNAERTVALRKLLESRDSALRALMADGGLEILADKEGKFYVRGAQGPERRQ